MSILIFVVRGKDMGERKVRNINGTSDNECKCEGGWLGHWQKFGNGGKLAEKCSGLSCPNKDLKGAHVQKEDTTDKSWYIIPLCGHHNGLHGKTIAINPDTKFAPANKSLTCERK
jgi:hypothetical protein